MLFMPFVTSVRILVTAFTTVLFTLDQLVAVLLLMDVHVFATVFLMTPVAVVTDDRMLVTADTTLFLIPFHEDAVLLLVLLQPEFIVDFTLFIPLVTLDFTEETALVTLLWMPFHAEAVSLFTVFHAVSMAAPILEENFFTCEATASTCCATVERIPCHATAVDAFRFPHTPFTALVMEAEPDCTTCEMPLQLWEKAVFTPCIPPFCCYEYMHEILTSTAKPFFTSEQLKVRFTCIRIFQLHHTCS
jgi:hypothetical protein